MLESLVLLSAVGSTGSYYTIP